MKANTYDGDDLTKLLRKTKSDKKELPFVDCLLKDCCGVFQYAKMRYPKMLSL